MANLPFIPKKDLHAPTACIELPLINLCELPAYISTVVFYKVSFCTSTMPIRQFPFSQAKLKKQKSRLFWANVRKKSKIYSIVFTLGGAKKLGQMGLIDFSFFRLRKA